MVHTINVESFMEISFSFKELSSNANHIRIDYTVNRVCLRVHCLRFVQSAFYELLVVFLDLDTGDGLRNLLTILKEIYKGINYTSALLIFGGVALSTHFSSLGDKLEFSPVVAAGSPITAKSTAVKAALSVFGNIQAYGRWIK